MLRDTHEMGEMEAPTVTTPETTGKTVEPPPEPASADPAVDHEEIEKLYEEAGHWDVNLGEETIHAKRIHGRFRRIKWYVASIYLLFFLGPYLRWDGRQAILFDIPARKNYIFGLTIWPQDVWMLSLVLLTFFITLFTITALAGRVFCGYICWQTVWVDVYTWIEEKLEGHPAQRRALDKAPWSLRKIRIKAVKHSIWLTLSALTGISFTAYFTDAYGMWRDYFSLQGSFYIWVTPLPFLIGSYIGVGFMREQICFWLCPYARIQGVMTDPESILPAYDKTRGEPRGKISRDGSTKGDCIDCNLCVAVCPMGVDIRYGQQEGCITCGLCLDACDSVMEKVGRPAGLIRYMALVESGGKARLNILKRPRMMIYILILAGAIAGVVYGLANLTPMRLTVIHNRQPLYVLLSDGSIQNGYTVKILNKTDHAAVFKLSVSGVKDASVELLNDNTIAPAGKMLTLTARVKVGGEAAPKGVSSILFHAHSDENPALDATYESSFVGPK